MTIRTRVLAVAALSAFASLLQVQDAAAATIGWSLTSGGLTGTGQTNTPTVPGSDFYGNTFTSPTSTIAGSPAPGFGFYDDFLFTIDSAVISSITSTINLGSILGINNLQVRLYNAAGNSPLPVLGPPVGGVIDAWSTPINYSPGMTGIVSVLDAVILQPGTYVLEVRGNVFGSSGGSYAGTINLAPTVPLPAALPLLLAGLGLLGAVARQRAA
jgi:hypothetical protein